MTSAACFAKGHAYFPEIDMTNLTIQIAFDVKTYLAWEE